MKNFFDTPPQKTDNSSVENLSEKDQKIFDLFNVEFIPNGFEEMNQKRALENHPPFSKKEYVDYLLDMTNESITFFEEQIIKNQKYIDGFKNELASGENDTMLSELKRLLDESIKDGDYSSDEVSKLSTCITQFDELFGQNATLEKIANELKDIERNKNVIQKLKDRLRRAEEA